MIILNFVECVEIVSKSAESRLSFCVEGLEARLLGVQEPIQDYLDP